MYWTTGCFAADAFLMQAEKKTLFQVDSNSLKSCSSFPLREALLSSWMAEVSSSASAETSSSNIWSEEKSLWAFLFQAVSQSWHLVLEKLKKDTAACVKPLQKTREDRKTLMVLILCEWKRVRLCLINIKIQHFNEILLSLLSPEGRSHQIVPGLLWNISFLSIHLSPLFNISVW